MNVARQDQIAAAAADATRIMRTYADEGGHETHPGPGPVVRAVAHRFIDSCSPRPRMCQHAAGTPMPVFARVHVPGLVLCAPCMQTSALAEPRAGVEDYRCDACGQVDPSIVSIATVVGPLTVMMGLCSSCHRAEKAGRP